MKKNYLLTILLLSLFTINLTYAYPPDNAAVIYYQYMVNFTKPDNALWDQINQVAKGEMKVNEQVRKYIESKQQLIDALETASEIPNCDWGLDFSLGMSLEVPHMSKMKCFAQIIIANAKIKIQQKQYQEALNLSLTNLRMAGHVGNDTLISYLIGTAMSALSYDTIGDVLSAMPPDAATLIELQREFRLPEYHILNIKTPLLSEVRCFTNEIMLMNEKKKEYLQQIVTYEQHKEEITMLTEADPEFLQASAEYYRQFFDKYIAALDEPYEKAIETFKKLADEPGKDFEAGNKKAFATALLAPATTRVYDIDVRRRTHQNALRTAIKLYQYYVKKGALPEKLPAAFPKDLFSNKSFEYVKTDKGFTLRCRKADTKDKTWEYEFKIQ